MNTDHENLSRNLEDLKHKITEVLKTIMSLEVTVARRAAAAEEALDLYTNLLSSLGLFPPLPPPLEHIDLTLELNTAASNTQSLLSGEDIRDVVKPTLSDIADSKRKERAGIENERIKLDNELDQLTVDCENVDEGVVEMEKKVVGLNEQADDLRDVGVQRCNMFMLANRVDRLGCATRESSEQPRSGTSGARACAGQDQRHGEWSGRQISFTGTAVHVGSSPVLLRSHAHSVRLQLPRTGGESEQVA